jgi:uncharacterized membrane-anchored protein
MKSRIFAGFVLFGLSFFAFAQDSKQLSADEQEYVEWATALWESIEIHDGEIKLEEANAVLTVPESFYFIDAEDAEKVLVDVWGNPPGQATLGMLFPSEKTPFDYDSWAVTIEYEEDGYVSDADADKINYDDLLKQMKSDTADASEARISEGYESIELVGWASPPYYDASAKKLHWAKEIRFGQQAEENTLNYNIRVLGRRGVLVLNFIAGIGQRTEIDNNVNTVLAMAEFEQGSTYSEFDPDIDHVAAYGIGALVAGKAIAKTGFLAMAIMLFKKFGIFIVVGVGALLKRIFTRKKS